MKTQILLDQEPVADGGYLVRALLEITGDAPDRDDRPSLDLALVLDRSGSMHGRKGAPSRPPDSGQHPIEYGLRADCRGITPTGIWRGRH